MTPFEPPARRIHYQVATSLDGYITGPSGEIDWIVPEPTFDFEAHFARFDAFLVGRRTWQEMQGMGGPVPPGQVIVFSRTLRQADHPKVEIVADGVEARLRALRAETGKDIWLFGGGELFRSLLELGQVDTVELAVIPVLLGGGTPFLPPTTRRHALRLVAHEAYPSGMTILSYEVVRG
jgi:dihydrofolate reductase